MTQEEKEKIDYEIQARKKAREQENKKFGNG